MMEDTIKEFQEIDLRGKIDPSLKILYTFLKSAVEFYDSKQNSSQETDKISYDLATECKTNT